MMTSLTVREVDEKIVAVGGGVNMARTPARKARTTQLRRTTPRTSGRGAQNAFVQALQAQAFELVQIIDAAGIIRYVSPAVTRVLGYQPEEVHGKEYFSFVHPDDVPGLREAITALLRQPARDRHAEYRLRHRDGKWRLFESVATNFLAHPGVAGIVINARDLTERRHTETALRESEERYRQLVELSPEPLLVHVEEKIAYVNAACLALFGARHAEELLGKSIWEILHPDSVAIIRQRLHQIRTEGRAPLLQEIKLIRLDGQLIDVEVAGAAIRYQGQPAVQAVIREIGERRRAEEAQRATEESYLNLFENANDAIATFSVEGIVSS